MLAANEAKDAKQSFDNKGSARHRDIECDEQKRGHLQPVQGRTIATKVRCHISASRENPPDPWTRQSTQSRNRQTTMAMYPGELPRWLFKKQV
jgi:hypothetical protein